MNAKTIRRTDRLEESGLRKPLAGDVPLSQIINPLVTRGELYEPLADGAVHCFACAHNCRINSGGRGICQVRYNLNGELFVPFGYVAALAADPTEKKPFFHIHPGSDTLTFGMLGCDLHCGYCQNWDISQAMRDSEAGRPPTQITPEQMVALAKRNRTRCVASSYNEPLITSEWAREIFQQAKRAGLTCMFVSNGNATRGVLEYIRPFTDGYKIDLKSMRDKNYRQLGAPLEHILEGARMVHELGFWLEFVTLIVPDWNDSKAELRDAAQFIRSLSPDIPWHVTAYHQDYKMVDHDPTSARQLTEAAEIGYSEGLRYVYAGNLPGRVGQFENTYCPSCHELLIERVGYVILSYNLTAEGTCPKCHSRIPGIWPDSPGDVRTGTVEDLYFRVPRGVR